MPMKFTFLMIYWIFNSFNNHHEPPPRHHHQYEDSIRFQIAFYSWWVGMKWNGYHKSVTNDIWKSKQIKGSGNIIFTLYFQIITDFIIYIRYNQDAEIFFWIIYIRKMFPRLIIRDSTPSTKFGSQLSLCSPPSLHN